MKKKILVVDDSDDTRTLFRLLLERNSYDISEASNGREGLKKAQSEPFDLIITDVDMPEIDGFTLVQKLRDDSTTGDIPIIVASAHSTLKKKFKMDAKKGISYFVTKPFSTDDLLEKIRKSLRQIN